MDWKKLSQRKILDHPRLNVYEDIIELPDGTKTDYIYFGNIQHSATIIAKNSSGKILIQQEFSYPPNQILYQFPGGGMNEDETMIQAAKRELQEEANLQGDLAELGSYFTDNRRHSRKQFAFLATNLKSVLGSKDKEEVFIEHWLSENEIDQMIKDGRICLASALSAWQLYKLRE